MNALVEWLASVASDPKIPSATVRVAIAIAALADDRGRLRARTMQIAAVAHVATRHMQDHVQLLADRCHLRLHSSRLGRFDAEIILPLDKDGPVPDKPFHTLSGDLIAAIEPRVPNGRPQKLNLYVDAGAAMVRLTIPRNDAEAIVAALAPAGANNAAPAI
jgi:hypothetical protein